jgi:hypothetical protein
MVVMWWHTSAELQVMCMSHVICARGARRHGHAITVHGEMDLYRSAIHFIFFIET